MRTYATKVCRKATPSLRAHRTGGVYLTVDGDAATGNRIVELREILATEDNALKEASLASMSAKFGKLAIWIRDSVCACAFSAMYSERKMMDRFHAKNRKKEVCKTKFNPSTPWNARRRYAYGRTNTVACEQMFRYFNQHSTSQKMGRGNYRAFWRHVCIYYNNHAASTRRNKRSVKNPCVSRRLALKTIGRR